MARMKMPSPTRYAFNACYLFITYTLSADNETHPVKCKLTTAGGQRKKS